MAARSRVPSPGSFERAKAATGRGDLGLSEVRREVMKRFQERGLHEMYLLYSPGTNSFGAYIFFATKGQMEIAKSSGETEEIEAEVLRALEAAGRGGADGLAVFFEFDSHDMVVRDFEGNYFLRLY